MDQETVILNKAREREIGDMTYMQNLKEMIEINLFTKQKQTQKLREWTYSFQWGQVGGRDD